MIWENRNIHRSKPIKEFLYQNRRRLEPHRLPPYAPVLNPVEPFNSQLKFHNLKNYCPDTTQQLMATVSRKVRAIRFGLLRFVKPEARDPPMSRKHSGHPEP